MSTPSRCWCVSAPNTPRPPAPFGSLRPVSRHHHEFLGLRALLLVNGFLHVDTQLAGILHDSINVFTCTPPGRLDLPLYFFSRFLFSQKYGRCARSAPCTPGLCVYSMEGGGAFLRG